MSHLLVSRDHVIIGLGLSLTDVLLLLVQLVDNLVLIGNLVLQHLNGVIAVALLQLNLGNSKLNVFDFLLDDANAAGVGLNLTRQGNPGVFLRGEDCLSLLQLSLSLDLGRSCLKRGVSNASP